MRAASRSRAAMSVAAGTSVAYGFGKSASAIWRASACASPARASRVRYSKSSMPSRIILSRMEATGTCVVPPIFAGVPG